MSDSECQELIDKGLKILSKRFNSYSAAIHNMIAYVDEMYDKYITSNDGLRELYNSLDFDLQLRDFFARNNIDIKSFFEEKRKEYIIIPFQNIKQQIFYILQEVYYLLLIQNMDLIKLKKR